MKPDLYYCIPAYNEKDGIMDCFDSLSKQDIRMNLETIVGLNGCTDKTEHVVEIAKTRFPGLNIRTVNSQKGKAHALNAIVKSVEHRDVPLAFVDADVTLDKNCTRILYDDLMALGQLIVVGAWPVPKKPDNLNLFQSMLFRILHMRAFYPQSEVSVNDVSAYKNFVYKRPQTTISPEAELRSKIYFHGRNFLLRNANFFQLPEDINTADDTFLPNFIHTTYGPGTIRTRFDAIAHYKPYLSIREHYKAYRRIFWDLDNIDKNDQFKESRKMETTKLDWSHIFSLGPLVTLQFMTYAAIAFTEETIYRALPKKSMSEVWHYHKK